MCCDFEPPKIKSDTVSTLSSSISHEVMGPDAMILVFWMLSFKPTDRMWSTGEGNGKPLQYSCHENLMNSMRRQKDRMLKEELPRSVGAQYATGDQWRNNSRKNEGKEPKPKQYPVVDVTGDRSKVRCCKEQHMYVHIYNYDSFSLCMAETSILWQNPAHCRGIILQLKIKKKK